MILGLDFGTTNTGAAVFDGRSLNLLALDPAGQNPSVCRTAMYFTRDGHYYFGREAINRYFQQNLGRRTKLNRVWVGEIMQVFAELPMFYRDVYVYEDEFSPGRIFLSIKTALRNPGYLGTAFQDNWYSASDLVATFLIEMKARAEESLKTPVREVVVGRPVHFSDNLVEDEVAQKRLLQAAFKAGFERVYLEYEPVAAARFYEQQLNRKKEIVLVFDFGGGTLDFTVMEIGSPPQRRILATGGIPIAGDVFDQRLFRDTIPRHLGEGSQLVSGRDIPPYIFDSLADWQEVLGLNSPENLKALEEIRREAVEQDKLQALIEVVTSNYALMLFDQVERAKIRLSSQMETVLEAQAEAFHIQEKVTRARFERVVTQEYQAIKQRLEDTIARSGLEPRRIDRVLRTGGSSQIPLFVHLLEDVFGRDKVLGINTFSSVTSGLAVIGQEIAAGAANYPVFTPDMATESETTSEVKTHRGVRQRIDLGNVRRQLQVTRQVRAETAELPYYVLLTLDDERGLSVTGADNLAFEEPPPDGIYTFADDFTRVRAALLTSTSDSDMVLLATTGFKLVLVAAKSILIAQKFGSKGIRDVLRLEPEESVTAMTLWNPARDSRRFLCLVTRNGQARRFEASLLAGQLRQAPYFRLEKKYRSLAAQLGVADEADELVLGTSAGRVARLALRELGITTVDAIKTRKEEVVTALVLAQPDAELVGVGHNGAAFPFRPDTIQPSESNDKRVQMWKRGVRIAGFTARSAGNIFALTAHGFAYALNLPGSCRSAGALVLLDDDRIVSLLTLGKRELY